MTEAKQLTDKEIESLREVKVSLNIKGLVKGWKKLFYKAPFDAYQAVARKVEATSKKMMTGAASFVSFPLGIILRNTSRAAYKTSQYSAYGFAPRTVGVLAAAAAGAAITWFGTPIIAGAIGLGILGTGLGGLAAATIGALSLTPVFSAATLATSTAIAAGAAAFSTAISAPLNLIVGLRRSKASLKGVKLTEDQIAAQVEAFDRKSPTVKYHSELTEQARYALANLPQAKRNELLSEFNAAQKKAAPATETAPQQSKGTAPAAPAV